MRSTIVALRVVAAALVVVGCTAPTVTPASTTILAHGGVHIDFLGGDYEAFGAQSEPANGADDFALVIPQDDLVPIGLATEAADSLFPDRKVFQF